MAKALVIKGVNFSGNAVDHITYDGIHAESISISQASATLDEIGGTAQLSYTVVPSDATDAVLWESSDSSVASVTQGGLVTATGCGQCTITVRAGVASATCAVTVAAELTFGRYKRTWIETANATNRLTSLYTRVGTDNTSYDAYLVACVGEPEFNNLIVSKGFAALNSETNQYELKTTRQGMEDAGLTGEVRIYDSIGFPVPIVLPPNCTKVQVVAPNDHYGIYPLWYKHDVVAYEQTTGTLGQGHWSPYRLEGTPKPSSYPWVYQRVQELEVPTGYDSITVMWKADGETGTVLPVDMTEAQLAEFKIIAL